MHDHNVSEPCGERSCLFENFGPEIHDGQISWFPVPSGTLAATWTDAWRARDRPEEAGSEPGPSIPSALEDQQGCNDQPTRPCWESQAPEGP